MRYNKFLQAVVLVVLVSTCACALLYNMDAEAAQEEKDVVKESKMISGKVGFINSEFISIIDYNDADEGIEHETLLYLDKDVVVTRKDSLNEIKVGDTVQIQYEKTTKTSKDVRKSKQVVKAVKFLKAAEKTGKGSTLKSGKK